MISAAVRAHNAIWWVNGEAGGEPTQILIDWEQERQSLHRIPASTCPSCIALRVKYGIEAPDQGAISTLRRIRKVAQMRADLREKAPKIKRLRYEIKGALWWEILERDDFRCRHCGVRRFLTVDHIIALDKGGTNDPENLQTLCRNCNSRKGNR